MRALPLCVLVAACGTDIPPDSNATSAQVYVAKVKNILVGQAPTDAEIQAVTKDATALDGLVDQWMQQPEYAQKMMVFFELAFQQTQITQQDFVDLVPPRGLGVGRAVPLVVQNVRESFARTALELVAEGQPFTDAFTTHRFMMTTALLEFYAFLDTRRVDDDGAITDAFQVAMAGTKITLETSQGPIPITDSLDPASPNYMHWYTPDLPTQTYPTNPACNGLDPVQFGPNALGRHEMLYGLIPQHRAPTGACPNRVGSPMSVQLDPSDFTDWRMVTIRSPNAGESRTTFYELPRLRGASELVIGTPRVGFFTTPAFFANWSTNASNQMRVTVNQALIVATGAAIDGTDATKPSRLLSAAHR